MMPSSDTRRLQTDAHLTAVLWTTESRWNDTENTLQPAVGVTTEEKLARLVEALEVLPKLAAELVEIADRVAAIFGSADQTLNAESQSRSGPCACGKTGW